MNEEVDPTVLALFDELMPDARQGAFIVRVGEAAGDDGFTEEAMSEAMQMYAHARLTGSLAELFDHGNLDITLKDGVPAWTVRKGEPARHMDVLAAELQERLPAKESGC